MNDAHSWCIFISKFTMSDCHHIEKTFISHKNYKEKRSCNDNDHIDDAIVIITLDQNVIFHFLTYTLMDIRLNNELFFIHCHKASFFLLSSLRCLHYIIKEQLPSENYTILSILVLIVMNKEKLSKH